MMNDETVLKYLADTLSEEEKISFENELRNNPLAKERFEEIRAKLNSIRKLANVQPNNAYFDSIDAGRIKNTKKKMFAKKSIVWAVSFGLLALMFFLVKGFTQSQAEQFMFTDEELQIVNQLTEYDLDEGVTLFDLPKFDIEKLSENFDEIILLDELDDSAIEYYGVYSAGDSYYLGSSELNDEDFSSAINELSNVKF